MGKQGRGAKLGNGMGERRHPPSKADSLIEDGEDLSRYTALPLMEILPVLPLMQAWGVSRVARSRRGFLTAYEKARGNLFLLSGVYSPKQEQPWTQVRENFLQRHMAQVKKNGEKLWDEEGLPTRRHLALVAWAYTPDRQRWARFVDRVREEQVEKLPEAQDNFERLPAPNLPMPRSWGTVGRAALLGVAPQMAGTLAELVRPSDSGWAYLERMADRILHVGGLDLGQRIACGQYGCVYEIVGSPGEVLKLTSDHSEAAAVHRALYERLHPELMHFKEVFTFAGLTNLHAIRAERLEPLPLDVAQWLSDPAVGYAFLTSQGEDPIAQVSLSWLLDSARENYIDVEQVKRLRDTITYLSGLGIEWMDLSGENVMQDSRGHWRIADLGASLLDPEVEELDAVSSGLAEDLDIAFSGLDGSPQRLAPQIEFHDDARVERLGKGRGFPIMGQSKDERPKGYPNLGSREIQPSRIDNDDDNRTWPGLRPSEDSEKFKAQGNKAYEILRKLGFRIEGETLGCGSYGCAYMGRPYVIKLTTDPAEVANAQTVLRNGGVEGVVDFYAVYAFRRTPGMFAVIMEKVYNTSSGVKKWINEHDLYRHFWNYYHRDIASEPITRKELEYYCEKFLRAGERKQYDGKKLVEGMHNLYRLGITPEDVHGDNVMLRRKEKRNGDFTEELVIIDLGHSEGPVAVLPEFIG